MKKITLFAIAALSLALASCSKEQIQSEQESGRTFSMTLNASVNETKATMSDAWKFAFSTGDKISLTNNQVTTYYELTRGSDGNFTGTVTAPSAAATWYAYYPSNNISLSGQTGTQTGTAAYCALAGKQENVAAGSKNLNITLSFQTAILVIDNQKGVMDINVKTSDGKWVSGFTATANAASFDVAKSDTKVSLLTATATGTYYVVVPAGMQIAVYDGVAKIKETKDAGLTAGKYYNVSVAIKTVADVLKYVEGSFPNSSNSNVIPGNAWVADVQNNRKCYAYTFTSGSTTALLLRIPKVGEEDKGNYTYIQTSLDVTKENNCYTVTHNNNYGKLTFNMAENILTSINYEHINDGAKPFDGTYTAPTAN